MKKITTKTPGTNRVTLIRPDGTEGILTHFVNRKEAVKWAKVRLDHPIYAGYTYRIEPIFDEPR